MENQFTVNTDPGIGKEIEEAVIEANLKIRKPQPNKQQIKTKITRVIKELTKNLKIRKAPGWNRIPKRMLKA